MATFQKLLVPTDGSPASDRALDEAADLVKSAPPGVQPTLTVLLAADPWQGRVNTAVPLPVRQEMERALQAADEFLLARAEDRLRARGVAVITRRIEGPPAAVIAQEAASGNYDLIVMGSRGLGMQNEQAEFLGSVTERVLRRVACPVLVVKQQ